MRSTPRASPPNASWRRRGWRARCAAISAASSPRPPPTTRASATTARRRWPRTWSAGSPAWPCSPSAVRSAIASASCCAGTPTRPRRSRCSASAWSPAAWWRSTVLGTNASSAAARRPWSRSCATCSARAIRRMPAPTRGRWTCSSARRRGLRRARTSTTSRAPCCSARSPACSRRSVATTKAMPRGARGRGCSSRCARRTPRNTCPRPAT